MQLRMLMAARWRWPQTLRQPSLQRRAARTLTSASTVGGDGRADEPRRHRVLMFPGQGSQRVGAGQDLVAAFPYASAVFDAADEALQLPLTRLMWHGQQSELRQTEVAQPAILTHSFAVWSIVQRELGLADAAVFCCATMGHSLGEYTALVAADAISFTDAVRLVHTRGKLMATCAPPNTTAMAALTPCSLALAEHVTSHPSTVGSVFIANVNSPQQVVITGTNAAVHAAVELARAGHQGERVRRATLLDVSAPFHSPLMQPIQAAMAAVVNDAEEVRLRPPRVPVLSNVTAEPMTEVAVIRQNIIAHLTQPVQWLASVLRCRAMGVQRYVEMGPSAVVAPLVSAIHRQTPPVMVGIDCRSLCTAEDVQSFLKAYEARTSEGVT